MSMSIARAANRYKAVQVQTSSPGNILIMLYDGMFKFIEEAHAATLADDRARAGERIGRAHAILVELAATLDKSQSPELCENLESIYVFCMGQLVQANLHRDAQRLNDVIRVLTPVRDAFKQAVLNQGNS